MTAQPPGRRRESGSSCSVCGEHFGGLALCRDGRERRSLTCCGGVLPAASSAGAAAAHRQQSGRGLQPPLAAAASLLPFSAPLSPSCSASAGLPSPPAATRSALLCSVPTRCPLRSTASPAPWTRTWPRACSSCCSSTAPRCAARRRRATRRGLPRCRPPKASQLPRACATRPALLAPASLPHCRPAALATACRTRLPRRSV